MNLQGKIDKNGIFYLLRNDKMKKQYCPFGTDGTGCGDWCPLFNYTKEMYGNEIVTLCNKEYKDISIKDER